MSTGTKFQAILMVSMVVVMLAGESMADYDDCYSKCKFDCRNRLELPNFICKIRCTLDCIVPSSTTTTSMTTARNEGLDFCNLGCASLKCANLINDQKLSGKERVEGCLESCSAVCIQNYMA